MKKTIKLAVVAALALGSTSAFATNGDHLIGLGAKARAMGGVGIAVSHGAESGLANPAMITSVKGSEISGTATIFMPNVAANVGGSGSESSAANMSIIPEISYATKVNDNIYYGIGMWGTAGMGVDYTGSTGMAGAMNMNMLTNLQLMQIGVPVAYTTNGFSVGVTPILQYGMLEINYDMTASGGAPVKPDVASAINFGYNLGLSYTTAGVTLGAVYKSAILMDYKDVLSGATTPFTYPMTNFGQTVGVFPGAMSDELEQPAEIGLGVAYTTSGHTIALDYKQIKWSEAKGYGDFKWDDQTVMAVGYEYAANGWALRLGYNKANNPVVDAGAMTLAQAGGQLQANSMTADKMAQFFGGNAVNMFNLLGFPATVESHMTIGGSYDISDATSIDVAYVMAPETSTTLATMPDMQNQNDMSTTVTHSQSSLSVQVNYAF